MHQSCGVVKWNLSICHLQGASMNISMPTGGTKTEITMELVVGLYIIPILCVLGLIGNILSIVLLGMDKERRNVVFPLQALAVADGLYLIIAIFRYPVRFIVEDEADFMNMQPVVFPLLKTCQSICIWMMVFVTIDRFVYVCYPLRAPRILSHRARKILVALVYILGLLYNIPRFFAQCILTVQDACSDMKIVRMVYTPAILKNNLYFDIYKYALYIILLYVVPLTLLAFMNVRLVLAIHSSRRRHSSISLSRNNESHDNNPSLDLIVIVVIFILCETPELIVVILTVIHRYFGNIAIFSFSNGINLSNFNTVSELLMVTNSAVNFFIYLSFGKRFRKILKESIAKRRKSTATLLTSMESYPLQRPSCTS